VVIAPPRHHARGRRAVTTGRALRHEAAGELPGLEIGPMSWAKFGPRSVSTTGGYQSQHAMQVDRWAWFRPTRSVYLFHFLELF
jgi:hypothetical protein